MSNPETREAAPRKKHIVQVELQMALRGAKSLGDVVRNAAKRSSEGVRSKLVLAFETDVLFPPDFFPQRDSGFTPEHSQKVEHAKLWIHALLVEKLQKMMRARNYTMYIERVGGQTPELLREEEYHEALETVKRVAPSEIWAFVFENTPEEYVQGHGENTDRLSSIGYVMW